MNLPVVEVPPVEKPVNSTPTEPFPTVLSAATARQRRRAKQAAEKRAFTRKKRSQ
jgi:hypothetical protein